MDKILVFLTSLAAAIAVVPLFIRLSVWLDAMDYPGDHSVHTKPMPLLGGAALYAAFLCGLAMHGRYSQSMITILSGGTIILALGLFEDIAGVWTIARLAIQVLAASLLIACGLRISFLPPTPWGNACEIILTFIWIIGLTNALNCLDGLDGLAAGLGALACIFFLTIALFTNQPYLAVVNLALLGACIGFLCYNSKPAKIFLGDAGATFLGFTLAGIALMGDWAQDNFIAVVVPVLILGVPIFDMSFMTIMRIKDKKIRNPYEWLEYTARDHFHHRLVDLGFTQRSAVLFIYAVAMVLGLGALVLWRAQARAGMLLLLQAVILFTLISVLMLAGKQSRASKERQ
ncbi:MAG: MraY family glycosyltransferase [Candidatus Omnitrophota bacterium]